MKTTRHSAYLCLFLLPLAQVPAADFPLEWKALTPEQAALCPANGPGAALAAKPPSAIRREPKAVSQYPLYGRIQVGKQAPLSFRLDEAGGSGRGYDRLIIDFNRNADFTDDPERHGTVSHASASPYAETSFFAGIENTSEWKIGSTPAPLCAKVGIRKRSWWGRLRLPVLIGDVTLRPAGYLRTTVALGNVHEPLGIFDYNCNFQLGELPSVIRLGTRNQDISFTARDLLLRDFDRNGAFDFNALSTDAQLFTQLLCFGTNALTLELDPNFRHVRVQPYSGPVGEVKLCGKLESVTLAWLRQGTWIPVPVGLDHGKATVPTGTYCLHGCVLRVFDTAKQPVLARGVNRTVTNSFQVVEGKTTTVLCGPPIELRLETKRFPIEQPRRGVSDLCRLDLNVRVVGVGGEIYTSYARGPDLTLKSPPPKFRVLSGAGRPLLTGQLEYG